MMENSEANNRQESKTIPAGEKFILANQVNYADGSVVSKVIVRNRQGNITLFAFDKGEFLSEHAAPFNALVVALDGKGTITISGQPFELIPGESIILPAGVPHAVNATERFKMMLVMIKD